MKKVILSFSLALFVFSLFAQEEKFDFRKTKWGMTEDEVKKSENIKSEELKIPGFLHFKDEFLSFPVSIIYLFEDNSLYRAQINFGQKHTDKNDFLFDYEKVKEALIGEFGQPIKCEVFWKNKLYKDDTENWSLAISKGHLIMYCIWKLERTHLEFGISNPLPTLSGGKGKILLRIRYEDKKYKKKN